jgi:hypothetical protein
VQQTLALCGLSSLSQLYTNGKGSTTCKQFVNLAYVAMKTLEGKTPQCDVMYAHAHTFSKLAGGHASSHTT